MILFSAILSLQAATQDSSIFPKGEIGKNTNNYTGTIWLNELNQPDSNLISASLLRLMRRVQN